MFLAASLLALVVGISLGLLGGGGSILALPLLVYGLGFEPQQAITLSLLVVGVTSVVGAISQARNGNVRGKVALVFGGAGMTSAPLFARLSHALPSKLLLVAFALVMIAASISMLKGRAEDGHGAALSTPKAILLGASVGALSGLVGAGGGFLIVPALVLFGGVSMKQAAGTSLMIIGMQSLAGLAGHLSKTSIDPSLALAMSAAAAAGALLGVAVSGRIPAAGLRRAFGWLVLVIALFQLSRELPLLFFVPAAIVAATLAALAQWHAGSVAHATHRGLPTSHPPETGMNGFTPVSALAGGALIGLAATVYLLAHGRVSGISGIFSGVFHPGEERANLRLPFVLGLVIAGFVARFFTTDAAGPSPVPLTAIAVAGLLVGAGTRLGSGCTSGHGVCGISRLSPRSLVATLTFITTGAVAVAVAKSIYGVSL